MLSSVVFPDINAIREALALAEAYPDAMTTSNGDIVIGRNFLLNGNTFGNENVNITCRTFFSLGEIELNTLNVFADNVILINKLESGDTVFNCKKVFYAVGCSISGPGKLEVNCQGNIIMGRAKIRHEVETEEETLRLEFDDQVVEVTTQKTWEWHEDPIDAAIRALNTQLDNQELGNWQLLFEATRETINRLGLQSILINA